MNPSHLALTLALSLCTFGAQARPHLEDVNLDILHRTELTGVTVASNEFGTRVTSMLGHLPNQPEVPCLFQFEFPADHSYIQVSMFGEDAAGKGKDISMFLYQNGSRTYSSNPTELVFKGAESAVFYTHSWYYFILKSDTEGKILSASLTHTLNAIDKIPDYLEGPTPQGTITCEFPWVVKLPEPSPEPAPSTN